MVKQHRIVKIIVLAVSVALGAGIAYYLTHRTSQAPVVTTQEYEISPYNQARDLADILKLFQEDWYWLSVRDYSYDRLAWQLNSGSPNEFEPRYFGKMRIAVLRENNKFAGFITYYMKNFHEGFVLYLAVRSEFRGKRYGQRLLDYAQAELKKMGANVMALVTRITNTSGNNLYLRAGFTQSLDVDPDFYSYRKDI